MVDVCMCGSIKVDRDESPVLYQALKSYKTKKGEDESQFKTEDGEDPQVLNFRLPRPLERIVQSSPYQRLFSVSHGIGSRGCLDRIAYNLSSQDRHEIAEDGSLPQSCPENNLDLVDYISIMKDMYAGFVGSLHSDYRSEDSL